MSDLRALAVLVFTSEGTLLRYSKEAVEVTGFESSEVGSLQEWCRKMFPDIVNHGYARDAIAKVIDGNTGPSGSCEFSATFQTAGGRHKMGHFTVVSTGVLGTTMPQILVSVLEQEAEEAMAASADQGSGMTDVVARALDRIRTAQLNLVAMLEGRQRQIIATSLAIRENKLPETQLWDDLFQEAFALVEIRDLVGSISDSIEVVQRAQKANPQQADTRRPLVGAALGKPVILPLGLSLQELERFWILSTLSAVHGNRSLCATRLGIALRTVRNKLKDYKSEGFKVPPPVKPKGRNRTVKVRGRPAKQVATEQVSPAVEKTSRTA